MAWSFVSPASRGIGFALTRHLLQTTKAPVFVTSRTDIAGTKKSILANLDGVDSSRLTVVELDVTDEDSISAAAAKANQMFPPSQSQLRMSFSIPGILHPEKSPAQINAEDALDTFRVNTLGPMLVMKHFSSFLPKKKVVLEVEEGFPAHAVWTTMSARVGSTSDNRLGGWYSYRASKAGVNSFTKTFDLYLQQTAGGNAMALAMHPGTVKTGLSEGFWSSVKEEKLFTPDFAAEKLVQVVRTVGLKGRGKCWDWAGKEIIP